VFQRQVLQSVSGFSF